MAKNVKWPVIQKSAIAPCTCDGYLKKNQLREIFGILVNDICKKQTLETSLAFDITYVYASLNV